MPSGLDLLRSPDAVSLPTYLLLVAFLAAASFTSGIRVPVSGDLTVLNFLIILLLVGLAFLAANRLAALRTDPARLPWALVGGLALAIPVLACVPLAVETAVGVTGLSADYLVRDALPPRIPLIAVYLLLAYVVGLRGWYSRERARVHAERVEARAATLVASGALSSTLASVVDDARRMSTGSRADADEMLAHALRSGDPAASARAAAAVRDAARTSVRSSGHRLWQVSPGTPESVRWREVLRASLRAHPLPMWPPALLAVVEMVSLRITPLGVKPPGSLLTVAVAVGWLVLVFSIGRAIIRRVPRLALVVTVISCAAVPAVAVLVTPMLIAPQVLAVASGLGFISHVVVLMVATVGASLLLTARDSATAVVAGLEEARREVEVDRLVLDEATARLSRAVAQHVHGTVQPGLIAASLAIDQAVAHGDRAALMAALHDARGAVDADFMPPVPGAPVAAVEVIDDLRRQWSGFLEVEFRGGLSQPAHEVLSALEDVVQESLNNAYVHGGARHAVVDIAPEPDGGAVVVITDDGSGPGGGAPGLGSAILAQATRGHWELTQAETGGAVVRAAIPGAGVGVSPYSGG